MIENYKLDDDDIFRDGAVSERVAINKLRDSIIDLQHQVKKLNKKVKILTQHLHELPEFKETYET